MSKLTIGADPELVLVSPLTNKCISAQGVFRPDGPKFGLDGNPTTLELRPDPAENPLQLADNIYHILDEAKNKYPQVFRLDMRASDNRVMAGGHIHLGHETIINNETTRRDISNQLDYLLAPLVALVEVPQHRKARLDSSYGKLGDMRCAPWGLEYRTPASWLATRQLAEAAVDAKKNGEYLAKITAELVSARLTGAYIEAEANR